MICHCPWCIETRLLAKLWSDYVPKNRLQYNMLRVVQRIERKYVRRKKNNKM